MPALIRQARRMRVRGELVTAVGTIAPSVIQVAGEAANGIVDADICFPEAEPLVSNPANQAFPRLAERRRHGGGQLSGGEQQMLAVGRALMTDPRFLLMDEPSEGLAPVMVRALEGVVARLRAEGLGLLLVEQNLYGALAVADRVSVLETGRAVHSAPASEAAADPGALTRFLGVH